MAPVVYTIRRPLSMAPGSAHHRERRTDSSSPDRAPFRPQGTSDDSRCELPMRRFAARDETQPSLITSMGRMRRHCAGRRNAALTRHPVDLAFTWAVCPGGPMSRPGGSRELRHPLRQPPASTTVYRSSRIRPTVTPLESPTTSYADSTTCRTRSSTTTTPSAASNRQPSAALANNATTPSPIDPRPSTCRLSAKRRQLRARL